MSPLIGMFFIFLGGSVIYGIWASEHRNKKYFLDGWRIFFHEKKMEIQEPFPMRGKPDIAFENIESGDILTGELKTRSHQKVYMADRVQISASRMLVAGSYPNKKVLGKGVILLHINGKTTPVDVETLTTDEMNGLYQRYVALVKGAQKPRGAENANYCEGCAYSWECPVRPS